MKPLPAHSTAEASLYVGMQPCSSCQAGLLSVTAEEIEEEHIDSIVRFDCRCGDCGEIASFRFNIDSRLATASDTPVISDTQKPSSLIDVGEWLTLYSSLRRQSEEESDRQQSRLLAYQAYLCIAEALKFYDSDNDLPPASAFFTDQARDQARRHPTQFTRQKLLALQIKLPNLAAKTIAKMPDSGTSWWKIWHNRRQATDSEAPNSV